MDERQPTTSNFERTVLDDPPSASARLECGICWAVYDPALGDPLSQTPPGTAFAALPATWTCPQCDAPKHKFMVLHD